MLFRICLILFSLILVTDFSSPAYGQFRHQHGVRKRCCPLNKRCPKCCPQNLPHTRGFNLSDGSISIPQSGFQGTQIPNTGIPNTGIPNTGIPNTGIPNTQGLQSTQSNASMSEMGSSDSLFLATNQNTGGADTLFPNVIGDFFGGVNAVADVKMTIGATFLDDGAPSSFTVNNAADLVNGLRVSPNDPDGFGLRLTAQQNLGDLITNGQIFEYRDTSINPRIDSIQLQSDATANEIDQTVANGGGDVSAVIPLTQAELMPRIRQGIIDGCP